MQSYSIPEPSRYGISDRYGFLSPDPPATAFQDPYYQPWDETVSQLDTLITNGTLEGAMEGLLLLTTDRIHSELEYRRAYVVLGFLIHGYVWCRGDAPNATVPPQLSEPFLSVCQSLRMQPVLSYAGLCSWNWKLQDSGARMTLGELEPLATFTGSKGEAAFYHVPVLIEAEGGHLIHLLSGAIAGAQRGRYEVVVEALSEAKSALDRMAAHLAQLFSTLEADFFYHHLRPFLAGGNGMEERGLPDGIVFQRSNGSELPTKMVGGSAAQSSLFPFLDIVFGIHHEKDRGVFDEMRSYMPGLHRDFLDDVARLPSLRTFVESHPEEATLQQAFNDCLQHVRSWRSKHIAIVSKYIVQPARQAEKAVQVEKIETTGPEETDKEWELQGTGGSALIPFLRQARDDTAAVELTN